MSLIETSEKSTQPESVIRDLPAKEWPADWWSAVPTSARLPQLPAKSSKAQLTAWMVILLVRFDALPKSRRILAQTIGTSVCTVGRVLKLSPLDRLAVAEGYTGLYPKRPRRPITDAAVLDFVRRIGPDRAVEAACVIERETAAHKTCKPGSDAVAAEAA